MQSRPSVAIQCYFFTILALASFSDARFIVGLVRLDGLIEPARADL